MSKDSTKGGSIKPSVKPEGPAGLMSQRQFYSRTGRPKSEAEAGAAGKSTTPKTY